MRAALARPSARAAVRNGFPLPRRCEAGRQTSAADVWPGVRAPNRGRGRASVRVSSFLRAGFFPFRAVPARAGRRAMRGTAVEIGECGRRVDNGRPAFTTNHRAGRVRSRRPALITSSRICARGGKTLGANVGRPGSLQEEGGCPGRPYDYGSCRPLAASQTKRRGRRMVTAPASRFSRRPAAVS